MKPGASSSLKSLEKSVTSKAYFPVQSKTVSSSTSSIVDSPNPNLGKDEEDLEIPREASGDFDSGSEAQSELTEFSLNLPPFKTGGKIVKIFH